MIAVYTGCNRVDNALIFRCAIKLSEYYLLTHETDIDVQKLHRLDSVVGYGTIPFLHIVRNIDIRTVQWSSTGILTAATSLCNLYPLSSPISVFLWNSLVPPLF